MCADVPCCPALPALPALPLRSLWLVGNRPEELRKYGLEGTGSRRWRADPGKFAKLMRRGYGKYGIEAPFELEADACTPAARKYHFHANFPAYSLRSPSSIGIPTYLYLSPSLALRFYLISVRRIEGAPDFRGLHSLLLPSFFSLPSLDSPNAI